MEGRQLEGAANGKLFLSLAPLVAPFHIPDLKINTPYCANLRMN
jgi:hypothetical protein